MLCQKVNKAFWQILCEWVDTINPWYNESSWCSCYSCPILQTGNWDSEKLCNKVQSKWSWTLSHAQRALLKLGPANSKSTFFPLSQAPVLCFCDRCVWDSTPGQCVGLYVTRLCVCDQKGLSSSAPTSGSSAGPRPPPDGHSHARHCRFHWPRPSLQTCLSGHLSREVLSVSYLVFKISWRFG